MTEAVAAKSAEFPDTETGCLRKSPIGGSRHELCSSAGRSSAIRNDVKRWKRLHEQNTMERLKEMRFIRKQDAKVSKENARKIARNIPVEILAKDWLAKSDISIDLRAYLIDKVMPTLILGVEKLLNVVNAMGLVNPEAESGYNPDFNPLNFLAQYLYRNNPRYSNFSEASPYVHSLRQIAEDLKAQLFDMEDNRLVRMKAEAKRVRAERELQAKLHRRQKRRRRKVLSEQFAEWRAPTDSKKVELSVIQNALRSFMEVVEQLPPEVQNVVKFGQSLEPTDETGRTLTVSEFEEYTSLHVENLPPEVFDQFMLHISKCASSHREFAEREHRRIMLTNLFMYCDHSGIGLLDRHRILSLFEQFWDEFCDDKKSFRNPRRWPVIEVDEADDSLSDEEEEEDGKICESVSKSKSEIEVTSIASAENQEMTEDITSETAADKEEEKPADGEEEKPAEGEEAALEEELIEEAELEGEDTLVINEAVEEEEKVEEDVTEVEMQAEDEVAQEEEGQSGEDVMQAADSGAEVSSDKKESQEDDQKEKDVRTETGRSSLSQQRPSITFAKGTTFERELTGLTASLSSRSQSQMSAFDESNLNVSQFVQLTETFLGEEPQEASFRRLLNFLCKGYSQTEDEKLDRLMKARKEAISANRRVQLDALFESWDNDGSGYLDLDEVEEIMMKYKEGQEKDTIIKARGELQKQSKYQDSRLSKKEFHTYVGLIVDGLPGTDNFEYFMEFLTSNVERSYAERVRGEARKKWLQDIMRSAETGGISLDPVYKTVFQSLYRDAESHGGEKRISANIALLERNIKFPERGDMILHYVACTPEDADFVLNKVLYKDMKGISFAAVEQGKPIHVPRVSSHGNIHFWNTSRSPDEREGSFVVVPLKDRRRRVFGILGIDTLADPHSKAIFITHEIYFFQGVAQTFSNAYHLMDMRRKLLRITESAISWIKRRSPNVEEIMVYMVEPGKNENFVLRRMMTTDSKGFPIHIKDPPICLERKDNLFRDYLFKSVDNSETVTADAYGNRHLAFPLRNSEGKAIAVVDICTGVMKKLPPHENKEMQRMLRLLQQAHKEITREFAGEEKLQVLDAEKDEDTRMDIMFDRLMLMELRENVAKLDSEAYAELKAYNSPPEIVLHILRATLAIFYSDLAADGEFDDWTKVKMYINNDLSQKIQAYDPTASYQLISTSVIEEYLKDVPHGEVAKHGSLPAQHLYNWVFVCLSLIEHTRKMRENMDGNSSHD